MGPGGRRLRVALLWNESVVVEEELEVPQVVALEAGPGAVFPLPEGVTSSSVLPVLEPHGNGYRLRLSAALGGAVWLRGDRNEVQDLLRAGATVPLGPNDYGVLTIGPVALFFQHVRPVRPPKRALFAFDGELAAGIGLSAFVICAFLLLAFLDLHEHPLDDSLELPEDLIAQYMVVPPPEDILQRARSSGTQVQDPGLHGRKDTGGKRAKNEEGRVGHKDAQQEETQIAGQVTDHVAAKVRNLGLLGALSGGSKGNAIADALDVPNVSDILGGMGTKTTIMGRGSGGAGLRGVGNGGGGNGPGSLFGAGKLGTGIGAGAGGTGHGHGGIGVPGRANKEVQISVGNGKPKVNGYLSAEQINRVVRAHQAAIRYCYELEVQREPNLRGRVEINWRINLQGAVTTARVARSTLNNARVEGCVVRQVRGWRFPQPDGGEVVVTYPFIFGVQGG